MQETQELTPTKNVVIHQHSNEIHFKIRHYNDTVVELKSLLI